MMMNKVVEKRKSVREFSKKLLGPSDKLFVENLLKEMPKLAGSECISYKFFEDGAKFVKDLDGLIGYNGVVIESPQYLVLTSKKGDKDALKAAGYASEWLVLRMTEKEVATCQISTEGNEKEIDEKLGISSDYTVAAVLSVGYPLKESFLASIFGSTKRTARQSVEQDNKFEKLSDRIGGDEFVYEGEFGNKADLSDENENISFMQAFYYMRLAPSVLNRQPWKFIIQKNQILLVIDEGGDEISENTAYIEAGIAMLYFEVAMKAEGYYGKWQLEPELDIEIPSNYIVAGAYRYDI